MTPLQSFKSASHLLFLEFLYIASFGYVHSDVSSVQFTNVRSRAFEILYEIVVFVLMTRNTLF